jgi:REP element-mobilizing transposase RayT
MDRILDNARTGPLFLRLPQIADLVTQAVLDGDRKFNRYELHAFVVMANHVHMLVTPRVVATKWLGPLKGFTAHEANGMLGRQGKFWQDESYDHLVKSDSDFGKILGYIEQNPVTAGLVSAPEEFRWSSTGRGIS